MALTCRSANRGLRAASSETGSWTTPLGSRIGDVSAVGHHVPTNLGLIGRMFAIFF